MHLVVGGDEYCEDGTISGLNELRPGLHPCSQKWAPESTAMQFNDYLNLRNLLGRYGHNPDTRSTGQSLSSEGFRRHLLIGFQGRRQLDDLQYDIYTAALAEEVWVEADRPFYNVWPIARELAESVRLDLPFSKVPCPFKAMLLRFAVGHEPFEVTTAMLLWDENQIRVQCYFRATMDRITFRYEYTVDENFENWLSKIETDKERAAFTQHKNQPNCNPAAAPTMIRLVAFIGLLANDQDLLTPVVLSKDRDKYDQTTDADARRWIEDRARRRLGRGFDLGRNLTLQRDRSPHWRNPHLCLFWTGPGRTKPVIQMRSGAVIRSVSMADVPTGYLGPETAADDVMPADAIGREPVSKSKRFDIMRRDGFRCQLCGKSQSDGVTLHIDHKVAVANGGTNAEDNLWTLCEPCNLGKSDKQF